MAVTTRYGLHAIGIHSDADGAETVLRGIQRSSFGLNPQFSADSTSGEVYNRWSALVAQAPAGAFSTYALVQALDLIPLTGKLIASSVNYGAKMILQKQAQGGTIASGSVHRTYTVQDGVIVLGTLDAPHQGDATLSLRVVPAAVGANDPMTIGDTQAALTITAEDARFTVGKVTVGGVLLTQVTGISIDFGVVVSADSADSDIWPSFVSVVACNPVIRINGIDPVWLSATGGAKIEIDGTTVGTQANTTIYLKKRLIGSTFVADNVAQHIKINAAGAVSIDQAFDVGPGEPAGASLVMQTNHDGSNAPLIFDTSIEIT